MSGETATATAGASIDAIAAHWRRAVPPGVAISCLKAGWRDLQDRPWLSIGVGLVVTSLSTSLVVALIRFGLAAIVFPALAAFLVVAPFLALGLYQKSQALQLNRIPDWSDMWLIKAASGPQILFAGALLCLLGLLWMRTAVLIYAVFFGWKPYLGPADLMENLVFTHWGHAMLLTGTLVGGLFAAFAFSISVVGLPMMLARKTDALTAMGTSFALAWHNRAAMTAWGAVIVVSFVLSLATGLLGLIVIFPLIGHASWHFYRAFEPGADEQNSIPVQNEGAAQ